MNQSENTPLMIPFTLPHLKYVKLHSLITTREEIAAFVAKIPSLQNLYLTFPGGIGENEVPAGLPDANLLASLQGRHLQTLDLNFIHEAPIPTDILLSLQDCVLDNLIITHTNLRGFKENPIKLPPMQVQKLVLLSSCTTVEGFNNVSQTLTHLFVSATTLRSISLTSLSKCPHLHTLIIPGVSLSAEELELLDQIPNLKHVFTTALNPDLKWWDWQIKKYTITFLPSFRKMVYKSAVHDFTCKIIKLALTPEGSPEEGNNNYELDMYNIGHALTECC